MNKQNKEIGNSSPSLIESMNNKGGFERSIIKQPELEGDTEIWLGQTIVGLIRLNMENDTCYTPSLQHVFKCELMASILEELNITVEDIQNIYDARKSIDEENAYEDKKNRSLDSSID